MPPRRVNRWRARDLGNLEPGYFLREAGEPDDAWKQVTARAFGRLMPHEGSFMPEYVPVEFVDGTERLFNPDDWVEWSV